MRAATINKLDEMSFVLFGAFVGDSRSGPLGLEPREAATISNVLPQMPDLHQYKGVYIYCFVLWLKQFGDFLKGAIVDKERPA